MRWPALLASLAAMALLTGATFRPDVGLILQARAGVLGGQPPANMPRGPVFVPLPLYPRAVPYHGAVPRQPFTAPSSPYVKAATAAYVIPTNWFSAKAWYDAHMAGAGFPAVGSGSVGQVGGSPFTSSPTLFYQNRSNPDLAVDVGFPDASGIVALLSTSTVVQYWVVDEVPPRRPRGSRLPADMVRVAISARPEPSAPSDMASETLTAVVTSPATVARLVGDVNALSEPTGGVYSCPAMLGQTRAGAELIFATATGRDIPVAIRPWSCPPVVVVDKRYDLSLAYSNLWTDVLAVVGYPAA